MIQDEIRLDANASAPPVPEALAALIAAATAQGGVNASSPHRPGRGARRVLDEARDACAIMMGARFQDVFFTSGATEGNRLAVDMLREAARAAGRPWRVVTSTLEHPSVQKPLARAHARGELDVRAMPIVDGCIAVDVELLTSADALVVTAAHNETGLITDLAALLAHVRAATVVVVDAAQSLGRLGAPPARADIIVCSAHKLGGVAGAGAVVVRGPARALPLPYAAGGQEQGLRPGTEPLPAIAALGAAALVIERTRAAHAALVSTRDCLEQALVAVGARVVGTGARLPNTTALLVPGVDGDALRLSIDQARLAVGFGAACSALAPEPSSSLMSLGLTADDTRRVVRLSLPPGISTHVVARAARRLVAVLEPLTSP